MRLSFLSTMVVVWTVLQYCPIRALHPWHHLEHHADAHGQDSCGGGAEHHQGHDGSADSRDDSTEDCCHSKCAYPHNDFKPCDSETSRVNEGPAYDIVDADFVPPAYECCCIIFHPP